MAEMKYAGRNEDGTPHYVIEAEPGEHVVITGPIVGAVDVAGESIDVSAPFVVVDSPEKALAVSDAIGARYAEEGHPGHEADKEFVHTPSELTHETDGTPKESYAKAVEGLAPPGRDSSPQGVIDHLTKRG